ncbi:shikimate kinase [Tepidimicrobium xylanilyticum]|uniref:Shikimate kinase n=1 Tax=Tepidimicrobium xylanilyticum TaxID=1123352 RepID=A0A1H3CPZ6_9FIRM|nr:shikimate kinase [Tepidimicrobium xylanilyticum]SDX56110.1 shikimate kinase [Tepidimicrobium xylanilyticum]
MNRSSNFKNIVLIGMSGSGKSAVGKYIAEKLNLEFIDTDEMIVDKTGQSINNIFKLYGEKYFRALEQDIIEKTIKKEGAVISTGGGVVLNKRNIEILKKKGMIFLLQASIDSIVANIESSPANKEERPLLKDAINLRKRIEEIYKKRRHLYISNSDIVVNVDHKTMEAIGDEIIYIFKQHTSCSKN